MGHTLRIGTRGSELAMTQTRTIIEWLRADHPDITFEIVEITTHGDRFADTHIADMGESVERGIFNSALEQALLQEEVDLATCSFKDVESELPEAVIAVSVGPREDTRDALVSRHGQDLQALPTGAVLATSSPRRTSQLAALRPDFRFEPLRGNIPTRVQRAATEFDGIIVAAAGLIRLDLTAHISQWIDHATLLPAAAQGAVGCEYHADRGDVAALVASIQNDATELCTRAEKSLMVSLSGGCYAPIGVLARVEGARLHIEARVVSLDGKHAATGSESGPREEPEAIVERLGERLAHQGAREIIESTRRAMLSKSG